MCLNKRSFKRKINAENNRKPSLGVYTIQYPHTVWVSARLGPASVIHKGVWMPERLRLLLQHFGFRQKLVKNCFPLKPEDNLAGL